MVGFVETSVRSSIKRFAPAATTSIILWNVFLPKPDVPPAIAANYRQVCIFYAHCSFYHTTLKWNSVKGFNYQNFCSEY
jgi:hypothetical protein